MATLAMSINLQAQEIENALLWKLDGNGLETSYIFGTMHALCDATLPEAVMHALEETQVVVLELDMGSPKLQAEMMQGMRLPKGETLSAYLSTDEQTLLDTYLKENANMSLAQVDTMNPLMIEGLLIPSLLDCPMQSIELKLMQYAKERQEEVLGLEDVQAQFEAFSKIPLEEQVTNLLKKAIDGIEKERTLFAKMQEAYKLQQLHEIMVLMNEEAPEFMAHEEVLLDTRNSTWVPRIVEISSKQAAFYGFGAAHLAGPRGVINLLREQGYELTPVSTN